MDMAQYYSVNVTWSAQLYSYGSQLTDEYHAAIAFHIVFAEG